MSNLPMPKYKHQALLFIGSPCHYFIPDLIKHITYQTNLSATQNDTATTFKTDENEILFFVAILLYMGVQSAVLGGLLGPIYSPPGR